MFWGRDEKPSIHLIGIGGSGMSGIAELLLASGFEVAGSDQKLSATTERLRQLGARIDEGHRASHLGQPQCVVVSSAVSETNPEWKEAIQKKIPVIPRAEMLAELMRLKKGVAVAGSHGKTTTTTMIGQVLRSLDPTVVVGGRVQHWNASSVVGRGSSFVIEADESDRSFLKFSPVYSVVTNIDREHLDTYSDLGDLQKTFLEFLNRTAFFGMNWIGADCENLREIRPQIKKPTKTFGFHESADLRILESRYEKGRSFFQLACQGEILPEFELPVGGRHNLQNATAAIGVGMSLGLGWRGLKRRLKEFVPADRRLQIHLKSPEVVVIEDYAHHPTEIRAVFQAVEEMFPSFSRIVLFQPHRYSRTKALWSDFVESFKGQYDYLSLLPIYAAHEKEEPGVSSWALAQALQKNVQVLEERDVQANLDPERLNPEKLRPAVYLILGAAPLSEVARSFASRLVPKESLSTVGG